MQRGSSTAMQSCWRRTEPDTLQGEMNNVTACVIPPFEPRSYQSLHCPVSSTERPAAAQAHIEWHVEA